MSGKLSSSDYLLLLLDLDNREPIVGAIRLMKMMFLFFCQKKKARSSACHLMQIRREHYEKSLQRGFS